MARRIPYSDNSGIIFRFDDGPLGTWVPTDIPGCVCWLDAQDEDTINSGSPSDTDSVTTWHDKSGNDNDADTVVLGSAPTWISSGSRLINGYPSIDFGSGQNVFGTTTDFYTYPITARGFTFIGIAQIHDTPRNKVFASTNLWNGWYSGDNARFYPGGNVVTTHDGTTSDQTPEIKTLISAPWDFHSAYQNLNILERNNYGGVVPPRIEEILLGGDATGSDSNCSIGEVLLYDRTLEESDVYLVCSYLAKKWGLVWNKGSRLIGNFRGVINGPTPTAVTGMPWDYALDFNGTSDYIKCPICSNVTGNSNSIFSGMTATTIEAWVKFDSLSGVQCIWSNWSTAVGEGAYLFADFDNSPPRLGFGLDTHTGTLVTLYIEDIDQIFNTTDWFHIAGTYDGSTRRLVINGEHFEEDTPTGSSCLWTNAYDVYIGKLYDNNGGSSSQYFNGQIAEISLSEDRGKSLPELRATYIGNTSDSAGGFTVEDEDTVLCMNFNNDDGELVRDEVDGGASPDYSLVVHWKMNDKAPSTTVTDSSGNGHHGTAQQNTEDISVQGIVTSGLDFNGSSDYVSVASHADFDFDYDEPFTMMCWYKAEETGGAQGLISKQAAAPDLTGYGMEVATSAEDLQAWIVNDYDGGNYIRVTGNWPYYSTILNRKHWVHCAATYDGSGTAAGLKLYVNGVQIPPTVGSDTLSSGTISNSAALKVGAAPGSPANGYICDTRIYGSELSHPEILEIWNRGHGTEGNLPATRNNHDGAFHKGRTSYWVPTDGPGGGGWLFKNELDGFISIPNHIDFNDATNDITIEMWYQPYGSLSQGRLWNKQNSSESSGNPIPIPVVEVYGGTGQLHCYGPRDTSGNGPDFLVPTNIFKFAQYKWAYVAATWDATNKKTIVYVNGSPMGSDIDATVTTSDCDNLADLTIGQDRDYALELDGIAGAFRVTNRKKTSKEIYDYYHGSDIQES